MNQIERAIEQARLITEELMFDYPEAIAALGVAGTRIGKLAATLTNEAAPAGEVAVERDEPDRNRNPYRSRSTMLAPQTTPDVGAADTLRANDAWKEYEADFNAMSDEEIEDETRSCRDQVDEAESWLEAVASWEAAGKPRAALNPVTNEGESHVQ